jgi:broad specificity phosphatase PhoE
MCSNGTAVNPEHTPEALRDAMRSIERAFLIGVPEATEVWLVRHGDCYDDMDKLDDPPLSALGREQARRLGARIRRLHVDAVYSSPLRRAHETAAALAGDVRLDPRLVEVATNLEAGRVEVKEQPEQVVERMRAAVADVVAAHPGGRVVMVGHGVAILGYVCDVLRLEFGSLRLLPYYTSVNVVRVLGERRMVGALADVAHLEA